LSLIVFSHANSFPAATYGVLLKNLRSRGFTVKAVDKFGHELDYPVTNNWPRLVQQLHDFAAREVEKAGEPAFLVGHSLGGFLSLMCAARHPHLARGVLLLDSPLLGGWKAKALGAMKRTQLVGSLSPGAVSRQRRNRWASVEAAFEHFRHKKAFAKWDEQVLRDYVERCTHDEDASAEVPGRVHRRPAVRGDEAGRHGDDRAGRQGPHHDAGRQPPVPDGKAAGHGGRHRSRAAQFLKKDRCATFSRGLISVRRPGKAGSFSQGEPRYTLLRAVLARGASCCRSRRLRGASRSAVSLGVRSRLCRA
jgi:pimeloyl-ACP methyl ester carboxylesterase